jgi:hypothetical protein
MHEIGLLREGVQARGRLVHHQCDHSLVTLHAHALPTLHTHAHAMQLLGGCWIWCWSARGGSEKGDDQALRAVAADGTQLLPPLPTPYPHTCTQTHYTITSSGGGPRLRHKLGLGGASVYVTGGSQARGMSVPRLPEEIGREDIHARDRPPLQGVARQIVCLDGCPSTYFFCFPDGGPKIIYWPTVGPRC